MKVGFAMADDYTPRETQALMQRLRRLGWILLGNQELADKVLHDMFWTLPLPLEEDEEDMADRMFRVAFAAFDEVAHGRTNVSMFRSKRPVDGLAARLRQLNPDERTAIAMMIVEPFSVAETVSVTGRGPSTLAISLQRALNALDSGEL